MTAASTTLAVLPTIATNKAQYQYSDRTARPAKVAYFLNPDRIASGKFMSIYSTNAGYGEVSGSGPNRFGPDVPLKQYQTMRRMAPMPVSRSKSHHSGPS